MRTGAGNAGALAFPDPAIWRRAGSRAAATRGEHATAPATTRQALPGVAAVASTTSSLDIASGELVAPLGPSGSSKTTVAARDRRPRWDRRAACGLAKPRMRPVEPARPAMSASCSSTTRCSAHDGSREHRVRPCAAARVPAPGQGDDRESACRSLLLIHPPELGGRYPGFRARAETARRARRARWPSNRRAAAGRTIRCARCEGAHRTRRWLQATTKQTGQTTLFVTR